MVTDLAAPPLNLYDLQRPDTIANPWPFYDRVRAESPYWDPTVRSWLVAGHADVSRLLSDRRFSAAMNHDRAAAIAPPALRHLFPLLDAHVSFVDGQDHARLRRVLAEPFRPEPVRSWAGLIGGLVDEALAGSSAAGTMDVVSELAYAVPLGVVRHVLGLTDMDLPTLRRWSNAWGDVVAAPGHLPTGDTGPLLAAVDELIDYLRATVVAHRVRPRDTITGALVAATDRGELSDPELIGNLLMLVTAGHETTANLIGNAVAELLDDPGLADHLRRSPEFVPIAIDELARLHPPTQYTARTAREDAEVGGRTVRAGQSVVLLLAAANRDPAAFEDPARVRLDRPATTRSVTFGHGPHFCFGAPLARLEVELTLRAGLRRWVDLRPAGPRRWRSNANLRGLESLPIRFAPVGPHATEEA
jgi:cytochrome P450